jgi:hypothetical protein
MRFTQQGQRVENVYHVLNDAGWDSASMTTLAQVFKDWWDTWIKALVKESVELTEIAVTDQTTVDAPGLIYTDGLPIPGIHSAGTEMPMNVTFAVKWSGLLRGRSNNGRTFHVGVTSDIVTGSALNSSIPALFAGYYAQLITAINTAGYTLVVCSYRHGGAPRSEASLTAIIAASIEATLDSQRRRLPGRGT